MVEQQLHEYINTTRPEWLRSEEIICDMERGIDILRYRSVDTEGNEFTAKLDTEKFGGYDDVVRWVERRRERVRPKEAEDVTIKARPLYSMKLHEQLASPGLIITRVPGGWLYTDYSENGTGGVDQSTCFVPFNDEFQKPETSGNDAS